MKRLIASITLAVALAGSLVAQIPASKHVYILAEENRSYEHIVGSSYMPYLNSLIARGTLFTQFYSNQHNSITDYFWVTSGQVPTSNDQTTATYDVDNIVRHAMQLGLSFKDYAQSIPHVGYAGVTSGVYAKRHTALPYYSDMGNSTTEMRKMVPVTQLLTDVQSGSLPNFAFVAPDLLHDMHNCPSTLGACEQEADLFLKTYIKPLLAKPEFQPGGDGLLFIWADEADLGTDNRCSATVSTGCGGRIAVVAIGPRVKAGYKSPVTYHHQNLLRTMLTAMGDKKSYPGAAETAVAMNDIFVGNPNGGSPSPTLSVTVQSPTAGENAGTSMHVAATSVAAVIAMQVYVDGNLVYRVSGNVISTNLTVASGAHAIAVKAWESSGASAVKTVNVRVTA